MRYSCHLSYKYNTFSSHILENRLSHQYHRVYKKICRLKTKILLSYRFDIFLSGAATQIISNIEWIGSFSTQSLMI